MLLELRRGIFRSIYLKNPLACCKVNWLKLKTYLFRLSPRERGFLISCLGVDGAGKSSLAAALCNAFNGHPCFQASVEYMGPWGHYYLNILDRFTYNHRYVLTTSEFARKLFRKARAKKTSFFKILKLGYQVALGKKLDEDEKQIHLVVRENSRFYLLLRYVRSVAYAMFFFFLIMIEMYYRYFKIYRRLRRGQIVITDRYIYDLMVGSMHEVASTHGRIRSFLCAIFFKPDKVFLLRNTPQQTLARKNQLTAGNLEAIQMIYDELARQHHFTNVLTDCEPRILAQRLIEAHFDEIVNAVRI